MVAANMIRKTGYVDAVTKRRQEEAQNEVASWASIAESSGRRLAGFSPGCLDHYVCRLQFNLVTRDRYGRPQIHMCTSRSVGANSVLLICRKPLPAFADVRLQLDDSSPRPWIDVKVMDNIQTVGGYAVLVEFEADARSAA